MGSGLLIAAIIATAIALAAWKHSSIKEAEAAAAHQPEPMEMVRASVATAREHRLTPVVGTVLALHSSSFAIFPPLNGATVRHFRTISGRDGPVCADVSFEQPTESAGAPSALTETVLGAVHALQ